MFKGDFRGPRVEPGKVEPAPLISTGLQGHPDMMEFNKRQSPMTEAQGDRIIELLEMLVDGHNPPAD